MNVCTSVKTMYVPILCRAVHTLSRNHPAEEPLLLCPMVIFLSLPRFGASIVNLSSDPRSKLSLSLSSRLSPFMRSKVSQNRDQSRWIHSEDEATVVMVQIISQIRVKVKWRFIVHKTFLELHSKTAITNMRNLAFYIIRNVISVFGTFGL